MSTITFGLAVSIVIAVLMAALICRKAKNSVSAVVSGAGFLTDVWVRLDKAVRACGGTDNDIHRLSEPEGEALIGKIAELIVGLKQAAVNIFKVTVDYSGSLAEMIMAGRYDSVNSDITEEHFPVNGNGKVDLNLELVHFNRSISSDNALAELKKMGFRPATLTELLAFGAAYPEEQREFPIVALGSVWKFWGGRVVPCLWGSAGARDLGLGWFGGVWDPCCRFLAVRESR